MKRFSSLSLSFSFFFNMYLRIPFFRSGDPRIFTSEVDEIVKDGIKELDAPLPPPLPEEELDDSIFEGAIQHRCFNLDMAETLLFMSCIIYERNDTVVRKAH